MLSQLLAYVRGLVLRRRIDAEATEELAFHLQQEVDANLARGLSAAEARRVALGNLGGLTQATEAVRDVRTTWVDMAWCDVRYAVRRLRSKPGMAFSAVALLALAIGITTAMFTVIDALFLRPLPFRDADRLVQIFMGDEHGGRGAVAPAVLRTWRGSRVFEAAEGVSPGTAVVDTDAGPVVRGTARVSIGLFDLLGVGPIRGRLFDRTEGRTGTNDRALISETLWSAAYGRDPHVIGRAIMLDGMRLTVVGVLPATFRFPTWDTEIWMPMDYDSQTGAIIRPEAWVRTVPDVPEADALRVATNLAHEADGATASLRALRSRSAISFSGAGYVRAAVPVLAGGVALVFLVLCANVGGLLLARFTARRHEFGLCTALGASRARLMYQASIEGGTIGVAGAAAGAGLAWILTSSARTWLPIEFLRHSLNPLDLDARALGVGVAAAIVATLTATWLPALIGTRATSTTSLRVIERTSTETRGTRRLTRALLVAEVALACTLLVGAAVLIRSFVGLTRIDLGFNPRGLVTIWMTPDGAVARDAAAKRVVVQQATEIIGHLAGVKEASWSRDDLRFGEWQADDVDSSPVKLVLDGHEVGASWFGLYGVDILKGRAFAPREEASHVVVSQRFADTLWPATDPVGRSFHWDKNRFQVIGVAKETRRPVEDLEENRAELYLPLSPDAMPIRLALRCDRACPSEGVIRESLRTAVPAMRVYQVRRLEDDYRQDLAQPRAAAALAFTFAGIALLAAAAGLFSMLTHAVGRRRREYGIRLAMGATPRQLRTMVLSEGFVTVVTGAGVGAVLAWLSTRALAAMQYGVTAADPVSSMSVITMLLIATIAAAWRPAAQAARVDPVTLLREE